MKDFKSNNKIKIINFLYTMLTCIVLGFLLVGYAVIAASTMKNNLFHVPYEPDGIQMLYYVFILPVFLLFVTVNYYIKRFFKIGEMPIWLPVLACASFYGFLTFIESVVTFPKGNDLFYYGSILLFFVFFLTNLFVATKNIYFNFIKNN